MLNQPQLRKFWSDYRWILLGIAWLAGIGLGYLGFSIYALENNANWAAGDILYRTLQLVTMNSGAVEGKVNWMLEAARFLLPLLTAYTVLQALMHLFREQTQKLRLRRLREHVVICGLGRKGSRLAHELLRLGRRVVIIEKDPQSETVEIFQRLGAIVLAGDATHKEVLTNARILQARNLVCLLGEDSANLQVAYQAYQLTRARPSGRLTCMVHLASIDLLNLIRSSELADEPGVPFELETFNPYERAARRLLQESIGWGEDPSSQDIPASLCVVGLGRLGEHLVIQAGYHWHLLQRPGRLRITLVDQDASAKISHLRRKFPQLDQACELVPVQVNLRSVGPLQNSLPNAGQPGLTLAYVCLGDPVLSLQVCLNLLQIPEYAAGQIWVRLSEESGLSELLEKPLPGLGEARQVKAFDFFDVACSAELILGGLHEQLARDLHAVYRQGAGLAAAQPPWEQLSDAMQEANRQQASRICRLLKEAGYRIYPLQDWDAGKRAFAQAELDQMASLEHSLWRQAKQADGWTYGEKRDDQQRTHPDLLPWEDLPAGEREKNYAMLRQLPALLARIGFQIERG